MITEHHNSAQIAAEVAARYGVSIAPTCKVQTAPAGFATTHVEYVWSGKRNRIEAVNLEEAAGTWRRSMAAKARDISARQRKEKAAQAAVTAEAKEAARLEAAAKKAQRGHDARIMAAHARAEAIRAFAADKTCVDVAEHMGITVHAARKYMQKFGINYVYRKADNRKRPDIDRAKSYAARVLAGETIAQIAESEGKRAKTVYELMRRHKVMPPAPKVATPKGKPRTENRSDMQVRIAARQAKVREMVAAGMTSQQIATALGVGMRAVQSDRMAMGIAAVSGYNDNGDTARIEQRRREVHRMLCDGMTCTQIARALGMSHASISRDIQEVRAANISQARAA